MEPEVVEMNALEQAIDDVMAFISNQRLLAVEQLFPDAHPNYQAEWRQRDLFTFWRQLDLRNRRRLVKLATEYYQEPQNGE